MKKIRLELTPAQVAALEWIADYGAEEKRHTLAGRHHMYSGAEVREQRSTLRAVDNAIGVLQQAMQRPRVKRQPPALKIMRAYLGEVHAADIADRERNCASC